MGKFSAQLYIFCNFVLNLGSARQGLAINCFSLVPGTLANSEDPDEILQNVAFHQSALFD